MTDYVFYVVLIFLFPQNSRGVVQNFLDFFDIKITRRIRASGIDWTRVYDMEEVNSELFAGSSSNFHVI